MILLLLLSIICMIVYTFVFFRALQRKRRFSGFVVAVGMYDLVYGMLPTLLLWQICFKGNLASYINRMLDMSSTGILELFYHYIYALIGFAFMVLMYYSKPLYKIVCVGTERNKIKNVNGITMELTAWISLLVGAVSLFLWSKAYGSIGALILQANRVRSGMGSVKNNLAFFKHPATVLLVVAYMFFEMTMQSEKKSIKKLVNLIGFIISAYLSYLFLMADDGRLTMLLFFMGFAWIQSSKKIIKSVPRMCLKLMVILAVAVVFILQLDNITYFIRFNIWPSEQTTNNLMYSMVKELIYLPIGGQTSINAVWNGKISLTAVDDLITGLFTWFPTQFKPQGFNDVWNINTFLIYGNLDRRLHGQVPCGIITQGYYDLRIAGVIILCSFAGVIIKKFDELEYSDLTPLQYAIRAKLVLAIFRAIPYCSLYDITLGFFSVFEIVVIDCIVNSTIRTLRRNRL